MPATIRRGHRRPPVRHADSALCFPTSRRTVSPMTMLNATGIPTSRRFKIAREAAGFKQEELARLVGVSRTSLGDWERGDTEPSFSKLVALARATNQPLDWFAEGLNAADVRPKGLEPPTFWLGVSRLILRIAACQVILDGESSHVKAA